jgi:hypothetical protein
MIDEMRQANLEAAESCAAEYLQEYAHEIATAAFSEPQEEAVNRLYRIEEKIGRYLWAPAYRPESRRLRRLAMFSVRFVHPDRSR